jgi:hypothetical protein
MPPAVQSWAKFLGLHFVNNTLGFGCGGSFEGTRKTLFVKTTDGGLTWDTMASTLPSFRTGLWDLNFVSPTVGYAAGIFGIVIKTTTDGGVFWNVEGGSTMGTDWTNPTTARLSFVTTVDHDSTYTTFAVGREGVIIKGNNLTSNAELIGDPSEMSLFPNPAKDEIEIEIPDYQGAHSIRCFNGMGIEMSLPVLSESRQKGRSRFNVKKIPSGIYFIRCINGNTTWVKRFVKE